MVKPSCRRQMAQQAVAYHAVSIRLACKAFSISETCYRYQAKLKNENVDPRQCCGQPIPLNS